jgi:hypothetical protein
MQSSALSSFLPHTLPLGFWNALQWASHLSTKDERVLIKSWLQDRHCCPRGILCCISTWEMYTFWLPSRNLLIQPHLPGQPPLLLNQTWQVASQSPNEKLYTSSPGTLPGDGGAGVKFWVFSYSYRTLDAKIKWEGRDLLKTQALKCSSNWSLAGEDKRALLFHQEPGQATYPDVTQFLFH